MNTTDKLHQQITFGYKIFDDRRPVADNCDKKESEIFGARFGYMNAASNT